jgi:hypothetical protein
VLLSRRIGVQPAGGVIAAPPDRRASIEAISTSPLVTVVGRLRVRLDANVVAVVTAPPDGSRALSAGREPATVIPRRSANARIGRWRRSAPTLLEAALTRSSPSGGRSMAPFRLRRRPGSP